MFAERDRDGPARGADEERPPPGPRAPVADRRGADRLGEGARKTPGSDPGPVKRGLGLRAARWWHHARRRRLEGRRARSAATARSTVANGAQDIGTGTRTVLAMLRRRGAGPRARRRRVVRIGDTNVPRRPRQRRQHDGALGRPRRRARPRVRARGQLEALARARVGGDAKEDAPADGAVVHRARAGRTRRSARRAASSATAGSPCSGQRRDNWDGRPIGEIAGCQFAQVAVDVETGVIARREGRRRPRRGRIVIDPLTARSQVNGGVIQGISYALFEERRLDRAQGDMVNPTSTRTGSRARRLPEIDAIRSPSRRGYNGRVGPRRAAPRCRPPARSGTRSRTRSACACGRSR